MHAPSCCVFRGLWPPLFVTFSQHVQVLIPQNGHEPSIVMALSNTVTLSVDRPYTQLVTVFATTRGKRVSASVLFSTIQDKATIVSARAPLPADAVWGPRLDAVASHMYKPDTDATYSPMLVNKSRRGVSRQWRDITVSTDGASSPISVAFLGSLRLDGQKHIWLHQMERLPRARFAPKYLTFDEEEERGGGNSATRWKTDGMEIFMRRLQNADVPLVRGSFPRPRTDSSSEGSTENMPVEMGFQDVLESIDSAEGEPDLMTPAWTREVFLVIAGVIERSSPDILVFPNSRTLGDVVIARAARWAMGDRGLKIVMDFPNLEPVQGIDVDILVTPSHFVARHPDTEALAKSAGAPVVVIPPGVEVGSPVVSSIEKGVSDALVSESRSGGSRHGLACRRDMLTDSGCRDPDCHVRIVRCLTFSQHVRFGGGFSRPLVFCATSWYLFLSKPRNGRRRASFTSSAQCVPPRLCREDSCGLRISLANDV